MWDLLGSFFAELQAQAYMILIGNQNPSDFLIYTGLAAVAIFVMVKGWFSRQVARASSAAREAGRLEEAKVMLEALKTEPQKTNGGLIWIIAAVAGVIIIVVTAASMVPEVFR